MSSVQVQGHEKHAGSSSRWPLGSRYFDPKTMSAPNVHRLLKEDSKYCKLEIEESIVSVRLHNGAVSVYTPAGEHNYIERLVWLYLYFYFALSSVCQALC